ncbi:2OG-Fe(II) oxygenase [Luteibaculum oceani]|uniref:2OG-Fe(II) oxygenase n=2 Tax=Luteibaculum oceani TaxID=1294296 RepID=A0A5C6V0I9_9FLAO|nr:2OG-Fe(II) oxygenase [Luteibaculum oceani]
MDEKLLSRLRNHLIRLRNAGELRDAGIGNKTNFEVNMEIRSDQIKWINQLECNALEQQFFDAVQDFSNYLNRTCFTGIKNWEFHYANYRKGSFFKRHFDRFKNDNGRKFSIVCYLNKKWVLGNGGELVLHLDKEVVVEPKFGTVVVFNSALVEHEVKIAHKNRISITGWLK